MHMHGCMAQISEIELWYMSEYGDLRPSVS